MRFRHAAELVEDEAADCVVVAIFGQLVGEAFVSEALMSGGRQPLLTVVICPKPARLRSAFAFATVMAALRRISRVNSRSNALSRPLKNALRLIIF